MKPSKKTAVYFRYLNMLRALEQDPLVSDLDLHERMLMDILARFWEQGQRVQVLELMHGQTGVMSPSTVHRRLKSLRKRGLVGLEIDEVDNRYKYVVPTDAGYAYFDRLGDCVLQGCAA